MRYRPSEYAKYLLSLRDIKPSEQKAGLKKFAALIEKNGDLKEWRHIADTYQSLLEKKAKTKTAVVNYAGEIHKTKTKEELKNYDVEFVEDKSVLGGVKILIGDLRIDNTIAGRLAEVRKALT